MGKYNVGDKFLTEVKIEGYDGYADNYYIINGIPYSEEELDNLRRPDGMAAQEAWEIVQRIIADPADGGMTPAELNEVFGTGDYIDIITGHTPQGAADIIKAWEEGKKIEAGDIVTVKPEGDDVKMVVTRVDPCNGVTVMAGDGSARDVPNENLEKTGRHIGIDNLLRQIGGEE